MATDINAQGLAAAANARGMPIGTFSSVSTTPIVTGRDIIRTSGKSASGDGGHALHRYDATVNAAYVAANPRISSLDATGRGFKLVEPPTTLSIGSSARADLRADEVEVGALAPRRLLDYFTPVQDRAILTGDYSAITTVPQKQDFQNRLQLAIDSAENRTLIFPQTHFIRVYAPITIWGLSRLVSEAQGWSAHAVIFQDGTVDWQALYPGYALFNTVNYNWPKRYAGAKPDFWSGGCVDGLYFRGDYDSVAAANPARIADGGLMIWCPNERVRVNAVGDRFALYGIAIGGGSSVLKGSEIGGFLNGAAQDTRWGHAVTRPASAFGANVYVRRTNNVSSTTVQLEAATATDLDAITVGNSLTFSRTNFSIQDGSTSTDNFTDTVASVGAAARSITAQTRISGAVTTTRFIREITLTSATAQPVGRFRPCAVAMINHPDKNFASGVTAADGGRSSGGSAELGMVSGDGNDALIFLDGDQIIRADVKSEQNTCVVAIGGNAIGGGRASVAIGGRAAAGATQVAVFDVMGGNPDVKWLYGAPRSYTNMVVDSSSATARTLPIAITGGGLLDYSPSNSAFLYATAYRGGNMVLEGGNIELGNFTATASYTQGLRTAFSGTATYRWTLGTTPTNFITADNTNGQSGRFIWCWDTVAVASAKCITFGDRSVQVGATGHSLGFLGATPVTIRTGWTTDTGTSKRTANATYSGTAEATYTQATIQTLMNGLRDATQTIKALKEDLLAYGLLSV